MRRHGFGLGGQVDEHVGEAARLAGGQLHPGHGARPLVGEAVVGAREDDVRLVVEPGHEGVRAICPGRGGEVDEVLALFDACSAHAPVKVALARRA